MLRAADLVLITIIDLLACLPHVSLNRIIGNLESIWSSQPSAQVVEDSLT